MQWTMSTNMWLSQTLRHWSSHIPNITRLTDIGTRHNCHHTHETRQRLIKTSSKPESRSGFQQYTKHHGWMQLTMSDHSDNVSLKHYANRLTSTLAFSSQLMSTRLSKFIQASLTSYMFCLAHCLDDISPSGWHRLVPSAAHCLRWLTRAICTIQTVHQFSSFDFL